MNPADYVNDEVALIDDHQAVELIDDKDMLRRVIVCCDCGLVHLLSINAETKKAYFVREDGPLGETVRERGRSAGHRFTLLDRISEERAARQRAEQERDEAQRAKYGTPCRCESWITACGLAEERAEAAEARLREFEQHEAETHASLGAILGTDTSLIDGARRMSMRLKATDAQLRAVIEAADNLRLWANGLLARLHDLGTPRVSTADLQDAIDAYGRVRDAQPPASPEPIGTLVPPPSGMRLLMQASPEPEASKRHAFEFVASWLLTRPHDFSPSIAMPGCYADGSPAPAWLSGLLPAARSTRFCERGPAVADIDLRAEVLKGIDREIGLFVGRQWPVPSGLALTALRHLREIVERHETARDAWRQETETFSTMCIECRLDYPCPTLLSLAPDYAPDALARMEASRVDILKAERCDLPGGPIDKAESEECKLWILDRRHHWICLANNEQVVRTTEDETLLYMSIDPADVPAIAALVVELRKQREASR